MRTTARMIWVGGGLASLLLGGCVNFDGDAGDDVLEETDVDTEVTEIVTGANTVDDTDVNPQWPEVVRICGGGGGCCSGTLVSPVHVLTAGHCRIGVGGTVDLDTPFTAGSGPGRRRYNVIRANTLSPNPGSGSDLELVLLDQAVPSFGTEGSPEYSVKPAFAFAAISNSVSTWTVGYGFGNDCVKTNSGVRRGLRYLGGFRTYSSRPGIVTRTNLPCDDVNKGPSPGDSGGPLLDIFGRVVGVFSGWSCRDSAGNIGGSCAGTIEWTGLSSANAAWLTGAMTGDFDSDGIADVDDPRPGLDCTGSSPPSACSGLAPDFEITRIVASGCTGSGGDPTVSVTVKNSGPVANNTWVDVFHGLGAAPTVGTYSSIYRRSNNLENRETQTLSFAIPRGPGGVWIDAIVDTTRTRDELNESNNVHSAYVTLPDCSFN